MTELERLRKERGLSKIKLAALTGMSVYVIYRLELPPDQRGFRGFVQLETAKRIAAVLDVGIVAAFPGEVLIYPDGFHYLIVGNPASAK